MKKTYLIQILSLLCALCFSAGGLTLFSQNVVSDKGEITAAATGGVLSESSGSASFRLQRSSKAGASSKLLKPDGESSSRVKAEKNASKPSDYIGQLNDKSQDIPKSMIDKAAMSSKEPSSKPGRSSSKTVSRSSSRANEKPSSSDKASSQKASSAKTSSAAVTSSESTSSTEGVNDEEIIFLSVGGKVKEYSALDAVALNVGAEMDDYFEDEAIKAQAVAAHTYMVYTNANGKAPVLPLRTPSAHLKSLVKSVMGKLIYYNGKPINAVYFATAGGYTANAEDIWGSDIPYLKSVESKYDYLVNGYKSAKTYTSEGFAKIIKDNAGITLTGSAAGWLKILNTADGGYVGKMSIGGKKKAVINGSSRTINGNLFRESILDYGIRSPKFEFTASDDSITFTSYGWGHGVGMSQDGANMYALKEKRGYQWILKHYYTGVSIK